MSVSRYSFFHCVNAQMVGIGDVVANKKLEVLARLTYRLPPGTHDLLEVQVRYQDATTETHIQSSVLTANFVKDAVDAQAAAPVGVVVEKVRMHTGAYRAHSAAGKQNRECPCPARSCLGILHRGCRERSGTAQKAVAKADAKFIWE